MMDTKKGPQAADELTEIARSGERMEDAGIDEADMQEQPVTEISPGAAED
jgi:hypothetical protein